MNGFKRFLHVVFAIAGLLALAALCLPWVGPITTGARDMLYVPWYFITLEVLVAITIVGLLVVLIHAIVARDPKNIVISQVDGGQITVSRDAVASQAAHIVESDGSCTADRVMVKAKGGLVNVGMRVHPRTSMDIVEKGAQLHDALAAGLAAVCGDKIGRIDLSFVQPESVTDPQPVATYTPLSSGWSEPETAAAAEAEPLSETVVSQPAYTEDNTGDITVPMGNTHDFPAITAESSDEEQ